MKIFSSSGVFIAPAFLGFSLAVPVPHTALKSNTLSEHKDSTAALSLPLIQRDSDVIFARSPVKDLFSFNAFSGVTDELTKEITRTLSGTSLTSSKMKIERTLGLKSKSFKQPNNTPLYPAQQQLREARLQKALQNEPINKAVSEPSAEGSSNNSQASDFEVKSTHSTAADAFWKAHAYQDK